MKLLRTFPKVAFEFGLASWRWMGIREQTPRFATCFGDIFLESLDGWWFLDTVEGTLELRWTSAVTMYAELESPEGRATYLMDDLVRDARSRGIHLGEEDVYTFNPHPALGGELGVNGLGTMRFELAVNWAGQMHDQVLHSSGEIRIPPMPDDGRGAGAPRVAAAWDSAWSDDETFDVPFEQYLATTTFAAVAAPAPDRSGYPSLPRTPGRERDDPGHVPYAAQGYGAHSYDAHGYDAPDQDALTGRAEPHAAEPHAAASHRSEPHLSEPHLSEPHPSEQRPSGPQPASQWPGPDGSASSWSGLIESVPLWREPNQAPAAADAGPLERYEAPYDAAPEQYGTGAADQEPVGTSAQQGWDPYGPDQDAGDQTPSAHIAPSWGNPTWGNTGWSGQAPAVAAGGSPQQAPSADPFTAWDDLWGRR